VIQPKGVGLKKSVHVLLRVLDLGMMKHFPHQGGVGPTTKSHVVRHVRTLELKLQRAPKSLRCDAVRVDERPVDIEQG
jgi:hypothetical protein